MDRTRSWELLAETTGDLVAELAPDATILWLGPGFAEVVAGDRTPEVGGDALSIVHPDDRPPARALLDAALRGERTETEVRLGTRAGWGWFHCHARSVPEGTPSRLLVIARDVTNRRALEDELRLREEKYRLLAESSNDVIWALGPDLESWYVSPSVERHLGWTPAEYGAMSLDQRLPPESYRKALALYRLELPRAQALAREGRHHSFRFEALHRHKDGRLLWGDVVASFVCDEQRRVVGLHGVTRNIDERKRMEQALARSEERFRRLFERMFSGFALLAPLPAADGSPDFRLLEANPAWEVHTGVHGPAATGRRLSEVLPDLASDLQTLDQVARTGLPARFERRAVQLGRWLDVLAFVPEDGQLALVLDDVTSRRESQEESSKSERIESVGVLAGGIAHDFNNLLTGILGNVTLARMVQGEDGPAVPMLDAAEKACRRARELTQQLLTFSKGGDPVRQGVSLAEVVREAAGLAVAGSRVSAEIRVGPDPLRVQADGRQLGRVVQNIVLNAVQAMEGTGRVEIDLDRVSVERGEMPPLAPGTYARIQVRDHGPGIPEEHVARIFDPYFTTREGGSGLGLAVAYSIIRKHDGLITVDPGQGRGAAFRIHLPAGDDGSPGRPADARPAQAAFRGRILVMDDDPTVREVLARMLSAVGFDSHCVADGAEAIQAWIEARRDGPPFAAALMDLTVPNGMGGREAMAGLLAVDATARGVVMSGYHRDPVMARYAEHGFVGVLPKPVDLDELGRVLAEVAVDGGEASR